MNKEDLHQEGAQTTPINTCHVDQTTALGCTQLKESWPALHALRPQQTAAFSCIDHLNSIVIQLQSTGARSAGRPLLSCISSRQPVSFRARLPPAPSHSDRDKVCMTEPVVPAQESIAALAENANDAAGAVDAAGSKKKASMPSVAYSKLFRWRWHDLALPAQLGMR